MLKIYDYALGKGLVLVHHAGFDPAFPAPFRSSPARFRNVANAMRGGVVVAAHLGGHDQWDDVEEYLAGSDIYLDTSMGFEYFGKERFLRIVEKHGAKRILFASDSPWSDPAKELETLRALPLPKADIEAIAGNNAARLLFG
jgi:predicted TIM-barrel fold metal-dependent hydrolase